MGQHVECAERALFKEIVLDQKVIARFWSKVDRGEIDECWNWTGAHCGYDPHRYGILKIGRAPIKASRIAYFIANGHIDNYLSVLHTCPNGDNTMCVNYNHLRQGTQLQNMEDMRNRDRSNRGERNGNALFTEIEVLLIRELVKIIPVREVARMFNAKESAVSQIKTGRTWKHLLPKQVVE